MLGGRAARRYDRGVPRDEPLQTARTGPPARSTRRSSRRPPPAPEAPTAPARPPGWLTFIAGAALTLLAYGAQRDPDPSRAPLKTATNAVRPAHREPMEHDEPDLDTPAARPERERVAELDAAAPLEEPSADDAEGMEPQTLIARVPARPDAGAPALAAPARSAIQPAPPAAPGLPPGHPAVDEASAPAPDESAAEATPEREPTRTVRHVEVSVISRWQQPGLCEKSGPAAAARRTMMAHFQRVRWEPSAILFLDPRLPFGTQRSLVPPLETAEREIAEQLDLHPTRPDVFAYRDTQLLLAGGCTNDNVVAYYDGDLHVVATHADVQQSITHEYTHHALMTAGLIAPAWAQEGIAMNVARETWWQTSDWLDRVAARPYGIDIMERTVPYTMTSEQSLAFYVQAAAMVWCSTLDDPDGLRGLVRKLGGAGSSLDYELPALADPSRMRACTREILSAAAEAQ